ncbi:hypothetical protein ONZ45_g13363 [Pleurotus djamor]|nr:hypothetical protein ONZ45_g13363 [Pleurotus djamor]
MVNVRFQAYALLFKKLGDPMGGTVWLNEMSMVAEGDASSTHRIHAFRVPIIDSLRSAHRVGSVSQEMSLEDCLLPLQEGAGDGGYDGYVRNANLTNVVLTLELVGAARRISSFHSSTGSKLGAFASRPHCDEKMGTPWILASKMMKMMLGKGRRKSSVNLVNTPSFLAHVVVLLLSTTPIHAAFENLLRLPCVPTSASITTGPAKFPSLRAFDCFETFLDQELKISRRVAQPTSTIKTRIDPLMSNLSPCLPSMSYYPTPAEFRSESSPMSDRRDIRAPINSEATTVGVGIGVDEDDDEAAQGGLKVEHSYLFSEWTLPAFATPLLPQRATTSFLTCQPLRSASSVALKVEDYQSRSQVTVWNLRRKIRNFQPGWRIAKDLARDTNI